MTICANCGRENPDDARFCNVCAAPLEAVPSSREQRKTVTVLFLAEFLASAGRTNEAAEALERALERYERKKNLAMVAQVRPRLEKLRAAVSQPH